MATIYEIERRRKEILLDMNEEELIALFKEINKKAVNSIGCSNNAFNWNVEEINKANEELNELTRVLKTKYPNIEGLTATTRLELLLEKYIESEEESKALIFLVHFKKFINKAISLEKNIDYLQEVLHKFYFRYSFRIWDLEELLAEELNVPEAIVDSLEPYIYYNTSFFNKAVENDYNTFIKSIVVNIESDIAEVKEYVELNVEPSAFIEEDVVKILEGIVEAKKLTVDLIKRYENLKANPFEVAIDIEANVKAENINKLLKNAKYDFEETTVEEEKAFLLAVAPSYNFETYELIVPDVDLKAEINKHIIGSVE